MARVRMRLSYDGGSYAGWQRQENARSVQQTVEEALAKLTGERVSITGASRTDAGVHALGQAAHFDTASRVPPERFSFALNAMLPADIRVLTSGQASPTFHARYHALGKTYRYCIDNAPVACVLVRHARAHVPHRLDDARMREALLPVLGMHDFTGLCASGSVIKDKVRTVSVASLERDGDGLTLTISGDGFLYNMVRIIAGTLIDVGRGKLAPDALKRAIENKNRRLAGATAPAHGLCLMKVEYEGWPSSG